jgi:hypothetical protein
LRQESWQQQEEGGPDHGKGAHSGIT